MSKRINEKLDKLIDFILGDHYDFEIVDNGGCRGEDLSVENMTLKNEMAFRESLRKILKKEWRIA